jgi:hypothetical protein
MLSVYPPFLSTFLYLEPVNTLAVQIHRDIFDPAKFELASRDTTLFQMRT